MSLDVMRRLAMAIFDARVMRVELTVCPDVNFYLQNKSACKSHRWNNRPQRVVCARM